MKSNIIIVLVTGSLAATALFYILSPNAREQAARLERDTSVTTAVQNTAGNTTMPAFVKTPEEVASYQEESNARAAASYSRQAELANRITPTLAEESLNLRMARWEPDYRKLFAAWNLSENKAQEVLAVIREREQNLQEELLRSMRQTSLEVGDHTDRDRVHASMNKRKAKWESALMLEQQQLLSILGPERYTELKDMEEKRKQAARKKAVAQEVD